MDRSLETIKILAGLVSDLCIPITILREYEHQTAEHGPEKFDFRQGVYRLCLSAVILNMAKFVELWGKYPDVKRKHLNQYDKAINLYMEKIKNIGVISFRNDYVAHTQSFKEKKILTDEEVNFSIHQITGGSAENLFSWVYPLDYENTDPKNSLVGIIVLAKEALRNRS